MTDPDGQTTTLTFNWMSHPTGEVDANGGTTTITYNSQGFPATETDPMGRTVDLHIRLGAATSPRSPSRTAIHGRSAAAPPPRRSPTATTTACRPRSRTSTATPRPSCSTRMATCWKRSSPAASTRSGPTTRPARSDLHRRRRRHHDLHLQQPGPPDRGPGARLPARRRSSTATTRPAT